MTEEKEIVHPSYHSSLVFFHDCIGVVGAFFGAAFGYFIFYWLYTQGFYAIALPGVFTGLFARFFLRRKSRSVQSLCGIFAVFVGLYTEWKFFPFVKDDSLFYFAIHLHLLKPVTWIFILIGAILAYSFSNKPDESPYNAPPSNPSHFHVEPPKAKDVIE
ncbi:MAG: hypothetical protein JXR73_05865 [Candidatus Omnitrophica bacterium]|nr:hypothetical protein [Candidatus Omnitrophota bacterium]